jgi:hypothetical protein
MLNMGRASTIALSRTINGSASVATQHVSEREVNPKSDGIDMVLGGLAEWGASRLIRAPIAQSPAGRSAELDVCVSHVVSREVIGIISGETQVIYRATMDGMGRATGNAVAEASASSVIMNQVTSDESMSDEDVEMVISFLNRIEDN